MNKKRAIISFFGLLGVMAVSSVWLLNNPKMTGHKNLTDDALLALIKNDQKGFEDFIRAGGNVHDTLPEIDGKNYTISEGISYFERVGFASYLHKNKISYLKQDNKKPYDILTITVRKNNPELLKQITLDKPDFEMTYGQNGWTLLHMASAWCSHKLIAALSVKGKVDWKTKAKDGMTPLTLAAENECLPMLSYWKEQGADFGTKDARGKSALAILRLKKDAVLAAFVDSFDERKNAANKAGKSAPSVPDFYKKRKIPRDQIVDHAQMLEPEDRPLEATETAEFSEFAD